MGDISGRDAYTPIPTPEVVSPVPAITSQNLIFASLGVAVLLVALLVGLSRKRSKSRGNTLLLVGPSDGGKTAILSSLLYGQTLPTHTSLQTNTSVIPLPGSQKSLLAADVPGHPRIRDQFQEHLPDAKAVAFVVDASTISRNGPAVAEHLHLILHALTSLPPSQNAPAFAIIAHKADQLKASASTSSEQLAINRVRSVLERELEKRRTSHAGGVGVESLGSEEEGSSELGGLECEGGGEFKFAQWEGGEVTFIGSSVTIGKEGAVVDEKSSTAGLFSFKEWLEGLP
ncbi:P-loop containing nucleoside triphosphate hydrolase protein [Cristinia sonorae]|uniref:Signal recognition particle receptor subunit beta n=1 Tax=Cristinia sonorae TaxID=1940300 RepID=A0A8K0UWY8_9AGAR|nr:P-loop containing nucleoside triphosphate hydrolase protein [Cristinia sonorae]